mmetsp:Transcript_33731/g.101580  ORF Transcript_33731/g.101580 Transcript_33731/m.101580 type:complete len:258 (+) Transcript_33731:70-843(+)
MARKARYPSAGASPLRSCGAIDGLLAVMHLRLPSRLRFTGKMALSYAPALATNFSGAWNPCSLTTFVSAGAMARCSVAGVAAAAARTSSTARGPPPAARSCAAHRAADAPKAGSHKTPRRERQTSARYSAADAASSPSSGSGLSTFSPTPRSTAFWLFTTWSPKPGQTSTGVPCARDSMKLFCPPCVRKRSTPSLSRSTCGRFGTHTALGGGARSPSASCCGPRATRMSAPSSADSAPKASKAPPQAARQSSRPVIP